MEKFASYFISTIFYFLFIIILFVFHGLQWIGLKISKEAQQKAAICLSCSLTKLLLLLGTNVKVKSKHELPKDVPLIVVSNHQSFFDITPIYCFLRKRNPRFVAKIELSRGIPSISFNLRHSGAVLIDRRDPKQSISAIRDFAKYIEKNKFSAVIYPEGTRSKNGKPKRFSESGFKILTKYAPSAHVVPLTINNSWKIFKFGQFPLGLGSKVRFEFHKAIDPKTMSFEELFKKVEKTITDSIVSD